MDAIMAVVLMECSMQGAALLLPVQTDTLRAPFPLNPTQNYLQLATDILHKLCLDHLLPKAQPLTSADTNTSGGGLQTESKVSQNMFATSKHQEASSLSEDDVHDPRSEHKHEAAPIKIKHQAALDESATNKFQEVPPPGEDVAHKPVPEHKYETAPVKIIPSTSSSNVLHQKPKNSIIDTSLTQITNTLVPNNKRKHTPVKSKTKTKISKHGPDLISDCTNLLNLVPSVEDALEDVDLDLVASPILDAEMGLPTNDARQIDFHSKMNSFREKFKFQPKQAVKLIASDEQVRLIDGAPLSEGRSANQDMSNLEEVSASPDTLKLRASGPEERPAGGVPLSVGRSPSQNASNIEEGSVCRQGQADRLRASGSEEQPAGEFLLSLGRSPSQNASNIEKGSACRLGQADRLRASGKDMRPGNGAPLSVGRSAGQDTEQKSATGGPRQSLVRFAFTKRSNDRRSPSSSPPRLSATNLFQTPDISDADLEI